MKSLLELVSVLSILTTLGGAFWALLGVISSAREFGGDPENVGAAIATPLTVAAIALALFLAAGHLKRKLT